MTARFLCMGYATQARDLRNLLTVAKKLRQLADDTPTLTDQDLYRTAAVALEARATWLASHLPDDRHDQSDRLLHLPVDLLV